MNTESSSKKKKGIRAGADGTRLVSVKLVAVPNVARRLGRVYDVLLADDEKEQAGDNLEISTTPRTGNEEKL